jgi:hypothetical protein
MRSLWIISSLPCVYRLPFYLYSIWVQERCSSSDKKRRTTPLRPSWASSSLRPVRPRPYHYPVPLNLHHTSPSPPSRQTRTNINCTSSPCPRTFAHSWTTGFARRRHIVWDSFRLLTSPAPPPYRKRKQSKGGAARGQRRGRRRLMLASTRSVVQPPFQHCIR